jgi:catechol 2,3-dioxygenase-like lactoylglutathione lyase family enzyme
VTVPARLGIVTLAVADVARSCRFFEALGWERASSSMPEIAWFGVGGTWIGLFGREDLAADAGVPAAGSGFEGFTLAVNVPDREAVDAALATALEAGATLVKAAVTTDFGGYGGYFADPDGHLWEIMYNPGFPLDADGNVQIP